MADDVRLPAPPAEAHYVTASAIHGGSLTLPERFFVQPADPTAAKSVPSLSFLIEHAGRDALSSGDPPEYVRESRLPLSTHSRHRLLFDLGLRGRAGDYTPQQQEHLQTRKPYTLGPTVSSQLAEAGIPPTSINTILFSHVHWDHTGDPADFENARFFVGPGSLDVLRHGLDGMGSHQHFDPALLPAERTVELPRYSSAAWTPVALWDRGLDLFGDGSVFVLDAQGHLPGHVNLLCRMALDKWVCLAGDAYHDVRLRTGEKEIATWEQQVDGRTRELCIHLDRDRAKENIGKLARLAAAGVEVIAAHDCEWTERNGSDRMFPRTLD